MAKVTLALRRTKFGILSGPADFLLLSDFKVDSINDVDAKGSEEIMLDLLSGEKVTNLKLLFQTEKVLLNVLTDITVSLSYRGVLRAYNSA